MSAPNTTAVDSLDDPRIADYRDLKDRELARDQGKFIAESELVVRRLLTSDFTTASVLLAARKADEIAPLVPPGVPVYVVSDEMIHHVVGFRFHSGVIACGLRRAPRPLADVLAGLGATATIVVLPDTISTENLGGLLRLSAGFGANAVILGPRCCDPFYRQSIRVSMGTVFRLNVIPSGDLGRDLDLLASHGIERVATVLDESAEPLATAGRRPRMALLLGNEAQGLGPDELAHCDRRVTIPMKLGTDSLNVTVAAGIFLYHFTR